MTRAALFDVDGTLVDTNYLHVCAWWEAFRQAGHSVPMSAVHRAIGLGSDDLIEHLLGAGRDRDQDAVISGAHSALYATFFDRLPALNGAADLLRTLAARGWTVVLATSASGPELQALRKALDADDAIHDTASSDDVSEGKPAPEPIRHAMELAGGTSDETVYVGDSVWDMKAATGASVTAVALLSGGIPREDLVGAGAAEVYRDPADLLAHLDTGVFARIGAAG
ncbi:HAD family hydrolase [Streptomyces brevispora]|uniref:HAD family hydrolase n=1 Tax=Streptomyces brevispora TaxID=887462 RepID=A0A561TU26_9ACTN|nr:HAD family hydrolase [Streptomyces brevispora]TWF90629.1 HAD superfamily hydrolase (TIGR01549 family) [Streptomyces brevispora]WSC11808.1 HAD family hydrolase [Streptomyces brevispora]